MEFNEFIGYNTCTNERKNLSSTLTEITQMGTTGIVFIKDFEIIVVDDHSSDDTLKLIKDLNEEVVFLRSDSANNLEVTML